MSFTVNKLDVVFFQRNEDNDTYEQINISGSSALFYLNENGILTVGSIKDIFSSTNVKNAVKSMGNSAYVPGKDIYALNTVTVGLPNRLAKYIQDPPGSTLSYKIVDTDTYTIDTPQGIGIGKSPQDPSVNATLDVNGNVIITGSLTVTGTVNFSGSSAASSVSSSYSLTSSYTNFSLSSSYAETSSITLFDGNRLIKRSPYNTLNVGGTTVTDFLENFFFPFIPATVALTSAGTTYYETGSVINFPITASITANDEITFGTGSLLRNGVDYQYDAAIPPLTYTYNDTNISSSQTYTFRAQTDNNGSPTVITSSARIASFIYPYLWGMSSTAGLSNNTLYTTFTRRVQAQGNKTVSMVGNVVYIYFCYPTIYPVLTSILDPNSFEAIGNFQYSASVPVTSSGLTNNWMTTYRVYRTTLVSDPNGNYQFRY